MPPQNEVAMGKKRFLDPLYRAAAHLPHPADEIVRISVIMRRAFLGYLFRRPLPDGRMPQGGTWR
jgi:hypothetical protein